MQGKGKEAGEVPGKGKGGGRQPVDWDVDAKNYGVGRWPKTAWQAPIVEESGDAGEPVVRRKE
eukprot:5935254-Alexandrium_andersonii.AAC.1